MAKAAILLADGFEEVEALTVYDVLKRARVDVRLTTIKKDTMEVVSSHGVKVIAEQPFDLGILSFYDALILPGGTMGARSLGEDADVISLVEKFMIMGRILGAICAAPAEVLKRAGVTTGRTLTSYPTYQASFTEENYVEQDVVEDGNLVTARGAGSSMEFALKLLEKLGGNLTKMKADLVIE